MRGEMIKKALPVFDNTACKIANNAQFKRLFCMLRPSNNIF